MSEFIVTLMTAGRPGPEAAKQPQAIFTASTRFKSLHDILFFIRFRVILTQDVLTDRPAKKFNFYLISSQNISPKV